MDSMDETAARRAPARATERAMRNDEEEGTRERILRTGERLFAERGFNGVSVRELAAAAIRRRVSTPADRPHYLLALADFLRTARCGLVAGATKARVMNGTSSLITASVSDGSQRPCENAVIRCGPAAV